ncbi:GTP pyrophosphokinase [Wohlfahrtiimonas populi]|uniref:GTP pyrophosphokinase n=1 Tax=Wohlfahrtiimonas populi TaxID=1940240 RepID=UPI00098D4731|nr:RelA/SpoT domain-containing protein [Wohlfahrtiimonas populi]
MASLDFEKEKTAFRDYWNQHNKTLEQAKETFVVIINSLIAKDFQISAIYGRVKDKEESIRKFAHKYQSKLESEGKPYEIKDHITDLIGLRLVTLYEPDVKKIKDLLLTEFKVIGVTDKISSMESKEDSFGYKGLHVDLQLNSKRSDMSEYINYADYTFELQIRTIIQDAWSVLDHKIKYKKAIPIEFKRRINTLAALFELADREFMSIKNDTELMEQNIKKAALEEENLLDAFNFLKVVSEHFSDYEFKGFKIDGFVESIISTEPMTAKEFNTILSDQKSKIDLYSHYLQQSSDPHTMNPYTEIRHMLYVSNKEKFSDILYKKQKDNFDLWLKDNDKS